MIQNKKTLLSIVAALVLTACGGDSVAPSKGTAVDGYLSGATVLCDTNNNGIADTGEATTTTGVDGTFTFLTACSSPLVITGGINTDTNVLFKGRLKALAGSSFVTPLTSLMVGSSSLTAVQIVTALGLPAGTDISNANPMTNIELQKKTLVMQQIIQQVTNSISGLALSTTPAALQAIYSQVAAAVATSITSSSSSPLINSGGTVNATLVSGMVTQSVANIVNTSDASLSQVQTTLAPYSGISVAALIKDTITAQAQTLSNATNVSVLTTAATTLQASSLIAQVTSQFSTLLTTAINSSVANLNSAGTALTTISNAATTSPSATVDLTALNTAAAPAITAAITAAQNANTTFVVPSRSNQLIPLNVLTLANDSINFNGHTYTLAAFEGDGVTFAKQALLIDTVSLGLTVNGTPIPASSGTMTATVGLAFEMTDTGHSGQVLQMMLDHVNVTIDSSGYLSVSIPASSKVYVYSKTASGVSGNLTLTSANTDNFVTVSNNQLSFNAGAVLTRVLGDIDSVSSSAVQQSFANLRNVTGSYNLKMVVSNLNIAATNPTAVQGQSVTVTGSGQPTLVGLGVKGIVTITQ